MNELQPAYNLLASHLKWLPAALAWMGAARLLFKCFNAGLQRWLTAKVAAGAESDDPDAEWFWDTVLSARWYRVFSFSLDLVASIKLPTHLDYMRLRQAKQLTHQPNNQKDSL